MSLQENNNYKIEQIKVKYFPDDFDCYEWLVQIQQWMIEIREYEDLDKFRERKTMLLSFHKKITKLLRSLELDDTLLDPTIYYQVAIEKELKALPSIKPNRPSDTYTKRLVSLLIMMYKDGSLNELSCYRNDYDSKYHGEFFHFMEDILPVLESYDIRAPVNIDTLGRYAVELIPQRREDKLYTHEISQIDELLLQE